jgi:hypothetical protein
MSSEDGYTPDRVAPPDRGAPDSGTPVESRIQGGLDALDDLGSRPLAEHALVYEGLHEQLQSVLAEIDGA